MTDHPITRSEQVNASVDAGSIEEFVNGAPSPGTFVTRLGRTIKTMSYLSTTSLYNWVSNVTSQVAAGPIITIDPTATPGTGGYKFAWSYQPFGFTQGPTGHPNYVDDVVTFGWNFNGNTRIDLTKPALWWQLETMFAQGNPDSPFCMELQLQNILVDGTIRRPWAWSFPHNGEVGQLGCVFTLDYLDIDVIDGTPFVRFDTRNGNVQFLNSANLIFASNNIPIIKCADAVGTSIELLRLNPDSNWQFNVTAGMYYVGHAGPSQLGGTAFTTELCLNNLGVGGIYHLRSMGTVAGAAMRELCTGSFAGMMTTQWINSSANGAAGQLLRMTSAGGADVGLLCENASQAYSFGIDTSDGNKLKFSVGTALGTTDLLTMNPSTRALTGASGTLPQTAIVANSGSVNDSSSGSGAFIDMTPVHTVLANTLTSGRAMRVTVCLRFTTGSVVPGLHYELHMGATVIGHWDPNVISPSLTNHTVAYDFYVQATAAPSGASAIETAGLNGTNQTNGATASNITAQPVNVATNANQDLKFATKWDTAGTGTNTAQVTQFIVQYLN